MWSAIKNGFPSWLMHAVMIVIIGYFSVMLGWPGGKMVGVYLYIGKEMFRPLDHLIWGFIINPVRHWSRQYKAKEPLTMPSLPMLSIPMWSWDKTEKGSVFRLDNFGDSFGAWGIAELIWLIL